MMDEAVQERVERAVALLRAAAPDGSWRRIDLVVRMLVGIDELVLAVITDDGNPAPVEPPQGLVTLFHQLRALSFDPGTGPWYSARLTVDRTWASPGYVYLENFEFDPGWNPPLPVSAYRNDVDAFFPDGGAMVPHWLADILE